MKVRIGFVSNSSSSSFIVVAKTSALTCEQLSRIFGEGNEAFAPIINLCAQTIEHSCGKINKKQFIEEDRSSWHYDDEKEAHAKAVILLQEFNQAQIYTGSIPSHGEGGNELESAIADTKITYEDDNIFFWKSNTW